MLKGLTGSGLAWEKFRKHMLETDMKWTVLSLSHIYFMMFSQGNIDLCCFLYLPKVVVVCTDCFMSKRFFRITCIYFKIVDNAAEVVIYSI